LSFKHVIQKDKDLERASTICIVIKKNGNIYITGKYKYNYIITNKYLISKAKHFNRFKHANFFCHMDIIDAYLSYLPIDEKVILKLKITFVLYANRVIRINIKFMKQQLYP